MINEFEHRGNWWLPEKPDIKIPGSLKFDPLKGAILELLGTFQPESAEVRIEALRPEVIIGTTSTGQNITLLDCFATNIMHNSVGVSSSLLRVNRIFIGKHFTKKEDIKFKSTLVRYSYLDEWTRISGFDISELLNPIVRYTTPNPIQLFTANGVTLSLVFTHTVTGTAAVQTEIHIEQAVYIEIKFDDDKHFEEHLDIISHIQNFLSIAIGERVYPTIIKSELPHFETVEVIHTLLYLPKKQEMHPSKMLFTFPEIRPRINTLMENWFNKADLFKPVYDLYFGTLYNPHLYLENKFLDLIYAIESFHRCNYEGYYLSKEEYKPINDALVQAIPNKVASSLRERLKSQIKYAREISLRKRLEEICEKYNNVLISFYITKDDFITKVVDTRNYLTHHDKDLKALTATDKKLYFLSLKLEMLLLICLLTELGFTSDEIRNFFVRSYTIKSKFGLEE